MKKVLLAFCVLSSLLSVGQEQDDTKLIADNDSRQKPARTTRLAASGPKDFKNATESDLMLALPKATAAAKVSIAQELVDRKSPRVSEVFQSWLKADESVNIRIGVIEYESNPASELFVALANQKEKAERKKYYERTNSKGLQKELKGMFGRDYDTKWTIAETNAMLARLTALAIAEDNVSPRTLNTIFYTNDYKSANYARVRFFAEKYPTAEILATLANFKNVKDLPLLTQHPQASYLAYANYPHAAFFPSIQMNLASDYDKADYQNAICAYKNAESKLLLEKVCRQICDNTILRTERDDRLFALYSIIEKRNCPLYNSLLKKIDGLLQ